MKLTRLTILFDVPDGGAGGGGGAPAGGGAPSGGGSPSGAPASPPASAAPTPNPNGAPSGQPGPTTPGAPGAPKKFEFAEDRGNWIPPHRLSEVAQAAQRYRAEAQRYRAMLEAGTGVTMRERQEIPPHVAEARDAFAQVYPGLAQLEARVPGLMKLAEALEQGFDPAMLQRLPEVFSATEHGWAQQGRAVLNTIYTTLSKDFGVESLNPRQQHVIGTAFQSWLRDDQSRVERYAMNDAKVIDEFIEDYRGAFVHPFRRAADARVMNAGNRNANLPPAPRSSGVAPPAGGAPNDDKNPDAVHDRAWDAFKNMTATGSR